MEEIGQVGDGQGGLVCCSPWGCKESDTTQHTNTYMCTISSLPIMANRERLEIDEGGSFYTSGWEKIQCDRGV